LHKVVAIERAFQFRERRLLGQAVRVSPEPSHTPCGFLPLPFAARGDIRCREVQEIVPGIASFKGQAPYGAVCP
jgi:hypothetical protein